MSILTTDAMNYASVAYPANTKNVFMEFVSIHKWTLMIFGGGLLTVPVLKDLPPEAGAFGFVLIAIGAWRQVVEIQHAKADAKRKQELHEEALKRLRREDLGEKEVAVLRELLGG
jgi:hypothetical protein